jgi:hypothetical protein
MWEPSRPYTQVELPKEVEVKLKLDGYKRLGTNVCRPVRPSQPVNAGTLEAIEIRYLEERDRQSGRRPCGEIMTPLTFDGNFYLVVCNHHLDEYLQAGWRTLYD